MPHAQLTPAHTWLGVLCYTLQIYFDFSGYSDMAIGLGRMFGFRFPENFLWPYISESVQEFWRRWHVTLSSWFRDYVYIPLGGSRISPRRTYVNLVTIFFLCGLWHGASWNFVVWGLFHGVFLVLERRGLAKVMQYLRPTMRHAYVMLVVMVSWVFFRAETLGGALRFLKAMAGLNAPEPTAFSIWWFLTPELLIALVVGTIGAVPLVPLLGRRRDTLRRVPALGFDLAAAAALAAILFASVVQTAAGSYNPFIYFRF